MRGASPPNPPPDTGQRAKPTHTNPHPPARKANPQPTHANAQTHPHGLQGVPPAPPSGAAKSRRFPPNPPKGGVRGSSGEGCARYAPPDVYEK